MTNSTTDIRFDLLRTLHAFVMGMSEEQFNLDNIIDDLGDEELLAAGNYKECGTIACGMGWAGLLPDFNKEGLTWDRVLGTMRLHGKSTRYDEAATKLFNLPPYKNFYGTDEDDYDTQTHAHGWSDVLFSPAGDGYRDEALLDDLYNTDHRVLFDARVKAFFAEFGQSL